MRHLSFKCLKMIISTNYALKPVFSKGLIFEDLCFEGGEKNAHFLRKFKLRGLC